MALSIQCYFNFLPFLQWFREGARTTVRPKSFVLPGVCLRLRAGVGVEQILLTPAPTPTKAKTVDSDRLQLRYRLRLRSPGYIIGTTLIGEFPKYTICGYYARMKSWKFHIDPPPKIRVTMSSQTSLELGLLHPTWWPDLRLPGAKIFREKAERKSEQMRKQLYVWSILPLPPPLGTAWVKPTVYVLLKCKNYLFSRQYLRFPLFRCYFYLFIFGGAKTF